MPFRRRPQSLVGILLHTYWTAFADDPLSALLFVVLASTAIVLLALVVDVAVFLVAQLVIRRPAGQDEACRCG